MKRSTLQCSLVHPFVLFWHKLDVFINRVLLWVFTVSCIWKAPSFGGARNANNSNFTLRGSNTNFFSRKNWNKLRPRLAALYFSTIRLLVGHLLKNRKKVIWKRVEITLRLFTCKQRDKFDAKQMKKGVIKQRKAAWLYTQYLDWTDFESFKKSAG